MHYIKNFLRYLLKQTRDSLFGEGVGRRGLVGWEVGGWWVGKEGVGGLGRRGCWMVSVHSCKTKLKLCNI